jgi:preprotein translocase subunit SecA
MDLMREGIGLRAFGATVENAALLEYKKEGHGLFVGMVDKIKQDILNLIFKVMPIIQPPAERSDSSTENRPPSGPGLLSNSRRQAPKPEPALKSNAKTGRNDPCPCGSGKKYKKCCGASLS